jgi:hypothetical protein
VREVAAQLVAPLDSKPARLQTLREDFGEEDRLGEVLRRDSHVRPRGQAPRGRPQSQQKRERERRRRDAQDERVPPAARAREASAHVEPRLYQTYSSVGGEREQRGGDGAREHQTVVVLPQAAIDERAQTARADEGRDRGDADRDDRGDAHAREDDGRGQRQLDLA